MTEYIGYAKNDDGGIDRYTWVNDIELEDLENYQARRVPVCAHCGRVRPLPGQIIQNRPAVAQAAAEAEAAAEVRQQIAGRALAMQMAADVAAGLPGGMEALSAAETSAEPPEDEPERYDGGPCPWCGSTEWTTKEQDFEEVVLPIVTSSGLQIPGEHPEIGEDGLSAMVPTKIPFLSSRHVPRDPAKECERVWAAAGNSDVDMIEDQQNTSTAWRRRSSTGWEGRVEDHHAGRREAAKRSKRRRGLVPEQPADKAMIDVYQFSGDLQYELTYLASVYEEGPQILGITDSFQGRTDPTATSGKAKEFSAAQAAGRLESKRVMKQAAYAQLFELMFKFWLAYSDEPRPISYKDNEGRMVYEEISRYDFLKQDEDGQYYWDDQFLFSCDTSARWRPTGRPCGRRHG